MGGTSAGVIVSLLPAATEWVYALGLGDRLAGVTFECDVPARARTENRVVVRGLETAGLEPGQIDTLVRETVAAGRDLYRLDVAAMAELAPDVVLTQDLCRVCALPVDAVREAAASTGHPSQVVTLDPHRLDQVLDQVLAVGAACGVPQEAAAVRRALQSRLDDVAARVAGRRPPRVLVLEWTDPPFLAGHWVPDLVAAAGGLAVLAAPGQRSATTDWATVAGLDLDRVLVAPCGFGLDEAVAQATSALDRLPAGVPVDAVDAGSVVTRPGPRVVDGVEALAALWHPGVTPARPDLVARVR